MIYFLLRRFINGYSKEEAMNDFWEKAFKEKQEMWGLYPAKSTVLTNNFFVKNGVKNVLIPGIGYGRNAQIFKENGMTITGIEISGTAIELGQKHFGNDITIYHGSVTEMPFDDNLYDGIYCYGLIYLLNKEERAKLIQDCYNQLAENGYMVFTAITKEAQTYGQGTCISKDRFEMFGGVQLFFYDRETIQEEFLGKGFLEITEVMENDPFYLITCKKMEERKLKKPIH
jgi:SAM-dependent methyltransferase